MLHRNLIRLTIILMNLSQHEPENDPCLLTDDALATTILFFYKQ